MNGYKKIIFCAFLLLFNTSNAQQYGNEWINFTQKYFHFPITQTGVHRIYYNTLSNQLAQLGINIDQIPHDGFQVYGKEKEVSILINDLNNNGVLDQNEYVEFYAEENDGWLDELVYDSLDHIPDKYYSLFNDTIRYYFTWNNGFNNKRTLIETDTNYNNYTNVNYCWKKTHVNWNSNYLLGEQQSGLSSPKYDIGEGWAGPRHSRGGTYTENLNTSNFYSNGPNAFGVANICSANSSSTDPSGNNHNTKLYVNTNLVYDSSYYGYKVHHISFDINNTNLSNSTAVNHSISNIGQGTDYQHVSSISIWYPHNTNFFSYNSIHFGLPYTLGQKQRLTFDNIIQGANSPILYMIDDINRIIPLAQNNNSQWEAVIPPPSYDSCLMFLSDESNTITISDLQPVNNDGLFHDIQNYQLDSAYIIITHNTLLSSSRDYATYRASQYDTIVLDINELYHQFSSGIYKNPLAIKRFLLFTMDKWPSWPSHVFLIGKSVRFNNELSPGSRDDSTAYAINLVPSWGYPSSDNHFAVGLVPGKRGFSLPIGRLSTNNNQSVLNYLNKVVELESKQGNNSAYNKINKEWQKNIAHFAGGSDSTEQAYMNGWLNQFKSIIEDTLYGGSVKTFGKDPFTSIINPFEFQEVQNYLEDGISLMTFFGHAASGYGFSQNIDEPTNWNNQGKYPLVVGLGCYSGDVHNPDTNSFAEQLIRPPQSGAIGFISTTKQGFIPYINNYTKKLYETISKYGYHKTVGQQMVMTVDSLDQATQNIYWSPKFEGNYNGMSLQGDPAIILNTHPYPELHLEENELWTSPSVIDLSQNQFELNIPVYNLGKAFNDSIYMEVKQNYPDGTDTLYAKMIGGIKKKDTIVFDILSLPEKSIGLNNFEISVDLPISFIQEAEDESNNNQVQYTINISSNSVIPIWPYDFGIVGNPTDTLRVSSINPLEPINTYYFEIDTTSQFNSPFLKTQSITSMGGVIEAIPNNWMNQNTSNSDSLFFTDSTVYYWRARPDSSIIDWKNRSFQYVPNKWGWGQAHFDQFEKNEYSNIHYNSNNRSYDFSPTFKTISCKTYVQHVVLSSEWSGSYWEINGQTADYGGYIIPAVMVGVIDPNTLDYWRTPFIDYSTTPTTILNPNNCFGQFNGDPGVCGNTTLMGRTREHGYFVFNYENATHLDSLASFLENSVPDGHYIIAYSYIPNNYGSWMLYTNPLYANWPVELFTAFQNLGASGFINQNQPDDGFIFFCEKGNPSSAQEVRSNPISPGMVPSQLLELSANITSSLENGKIISPLIGPSYNWKSIYWGQNALENPTTDSTRIKIMGVLSPNSNQQDTLIDTLFTANDSLTNLAAQLNAYPYIKLEMETYDDSLLTPAQIEKWQLIYDPLPDLALNPKKSWFFDFDTTSLQQGDTGYFCVAIENVTPFNMDSLLVEYKIENNNTSAFLNYPRLDSLRSRAVIADTIPLVTRYLQDENNLWITANPIVSNGLQDQAEQFYFNNFLQKTFSISKDITNPILDVTFDGVHIINNDIVSPNPAILITLDDENPFLILNEDFDTANFQVEIIKPNSTIWEKIHFINGQGVPNLNWQLAAQENKFTIEYNPTFNEDGTYGLKVQGQDKSGNTSGDEAYQIYFEVVQESKITNLYNYPNPFSSKTHFVFTLTGSELPTELNIQILNINGRLIKQIPLHTLEDIKIGHNITNYYWDGRDDFGDPLANGVYLYKVDAKINNESIDHRTSSGDHAFTKGFGKMYLIK